MKSIEVLEKIMAAAYARGMRPAPEERDGAKTEREIEREKLLMKYESVGIDRTTEKTR